MESIRFDHNKLNDHISTTFPDYNESSASLTSSASANSTLKRKNDGFDDAKSTNAEKKKKLSTNIANSNEFLPEEDEMNQRLSYKQIIEKAVKSITEAASKEAEELSDVQLKNEELAQKLMALTSERDKTRSILIKVNEDRAKEKEAWAGKLKAITLERNESQSALVKANTLHVGSINKLKEVLAQNKLAMDDMTLQLKEAKTALIRTGEEYAKRDSDQQTRNEELASKLKAMNLVLNDTESVLRKANKDHTIEKRQLEQLFHKCDTELTEVNNRIVNLTLESEKKLEDAKSEHQKQMEKMKKDLNADHTKSLQKIKKEFETQIKNLQEKHKIEVDEEKRRLASEIESEY